MWSLYYVVCLGSQVEGVQYHPPNASWPNPDIMRTMPFDYTIHDPKYDDISAVYNPGYVPSAEGRKNYRRIHKWTQPEVYSQNIHLVHMVASCEFYIVLSFKGHRMRQEDVYLRRRTARIKLSKYAAYNTYHHCEQCHQYLGFNPRYQVRGTQSLMNDTHTVLFKM